MSRTKATQPRFASSTTSLSTSALVPASPSRSGKDRKFDTIAAIGAVTRPAVGLGFFGENTFTINPQLLDHLHFKHPGAWSISVKESTSKVKRKKRSKKMEPVLTVYVSTPDKSMTLARSRQEVYDLDRKLRLDLADRIPTLQHPAAPPLPKKRTVLAAISQTLSPRRPPPPSSSSKQPTVKPVDITDFSRYLTDASTDAGVRSHSAWKAFFAVGLDDLESVRVERRIKRTRSEIIHLSEVGSPMTMDEDIIAFQPKTTTGLGKREASASIAPSYDDSLISPEIGSPVSPTFTSPSTIASPSTSSTGHFDAKSVAGETQNPSPMIASRRLLPSMNDMVDVPESIEMEEEMKPEEVLTEEVPTEETVDVADDAGVVVPSEVSSFGGRKSRAGKSRLSIDSFEIMRVLGKGCAGKVLLVRRKDTQELFALKAIHKTHVLAHRELQHTITEQQVLKRCSADQTNPFVVRLHYSFHDAETLYLALDFHNGGDLATQLARWGRLGRDRARFYCAEIVEGVEGLHRAGYIYRDLKPENILISSEGHCVLTDFGLSKDFGHSKVLEIGNEARPHWLGSPSMRSASAPIGIWTAKRETTMTFCGTAEYLAPEVLLGEAYSYEVDAWSCGTLLFEMLAGVTPFWSESHSEMYTKVLHSPLSFDDTDPRIFDDDTKNLLRGMLQKDPLLRMTDVRIKKHPYFSMIDWGHIFAKRYVAPFIPSSNSLEDTQNFDESFLTMSPDVGGDETREGEEEREAPEGEPQEAVDEHGNDVFDGYSFHGHDEEIDFEEEESDDEEIMEADTTERTFGTDATSTEIIIDSPSPSSPHLPYSQTLSSVVEIPIIISSNDMLVESPVEPVDEEIEEDEWDLVEAAGESRNGGKGTTLWARGVKDRFKLVVNTPDRPRSVFVKSQNPSRRNLNLNLSRSGSLTPDTRRPLYRLGSYRSTHSGTTTTARGSASGSRNESTEIVNSRILSSVSTTPSSSRPPSSRSSIAGGLKRALSFRPSPK